MNTKLKKTVTSSGTFWTHIFIGILILQALIELGVGAAILFAFPTTLETAFWITYSSELDILWIALGLYLLLLTALLVLSAVWTRRGNRAWIIIGIISWVFLFSFGVAAFLKTWDTQAIFVDSFRWALTVIFAYMAWKELK